MRISPTKLREAREAAGLNPSQLSKAAGFSRGYVHRIEDGSRGSNVSAQTLDGLATALGVEPATLLDEDDDPQPVPPVPPPETVPRQASPTPAEEPHPEAWRWG